MTGLTLRPLRWDGDEIHPDDLAAADSVLAAYETHHLGMRDMATEELHDSLTMPWIVRDRTVLVLDGDGLAVDHGLRTTREGTWAIGDAVGGEHRRFQFTHAATYDGPQVAENIIIGAAANCPYRCKLQLRWTKEMKGG